MMTLGLTGGIACGKTTVAGWLQDLGASVMDADAISRSITKTGGEALPAIREAFGGEVFTDGGELDRAALGDRVFANEADRVRLNAILHPMIARRMAEEIADCRKKGAQIVVLDIPLLYEAGMETMADRVVCVSARMETQIARLKVRNGLSRSEALMRIRSQWPLSEKEARADFVIYTDRPTEDAYAKTADMYYALLKGAYDDSTSPKIP